MNAELAEALLRSIVEAQDCFLDAAELVAAGVIGQGRYQRAADRFHGAVDRAADAVASLDRARCDVAEAYQEIGADAEVDCDDFLQLTQEQLRDQLTYVGDYQG